MDAPRGAVTLFERSRDRIEAKGARYGPVYPWWIPVISTAGLFGGAALGGLQRVDVAPVPLIVLAALVTMAPCALHFIIRPWIPWWIELPTVLLGVGILVSYPVPSGEAADLAPMSAAFAVGEVTATDGARRGAVAVAASAAVVLGLGTYSRPTATLAVGELLVGLVVGYMLRWQMRALAAEHARHDEERVRATLAERQRVASEIHDLVAHSLAVTMLQVTGARRALEQDADIPDAVEALTEAERIGRQAMADIRRTVGVLRTDESSELRPLPGGADLDVLVEEFRSAGLDVTWSCSGDVGRVGGTAGLGLYRVVQESLANVVKHAPGAPATVRLEIGPTETRLVVTNPVLAGAVVATDGSGVAGMTSRAGQLGGRLDVGPDGDAWRVDLTVPTGPTAPTAPTGPTVSTRAPTP